MPAMLDPSIATIQSLKTSICNMLQSPLAQELKTPAIAFMLTSVNKWSKQIPLMFNSSAAPASANVVFAIRKELFHGPSFTHSIFNIGLSDLPTPFQEFAAFIHAIIDAQKSDKEPIIPAKVHLFFCSIITIDQ